jgi:hypothetical protein
MEDTVDSLPRVVFFLLSFFLFANIFGAHTVKAVVRRSPGLVTGKPTIIVQQYGQAGLSEKNRGGVWVSE